MKLKSQLPLLLCGLTSLYSCGDGSSNNTTSSLTFKGKIGQSYENSQEDYPQPLRAPKNAPNVVLILLDDVGFGQPGAFGGPIPTPAMDKLAANGLSYNCFHTTGISSPTRAALLTGRNHHQAGFGTISELSTGYPGYNSIWGKDLASVAEVLKDNGYSTAAWGKWHNTPDWETSPIGPFDRWPTGKGFEYFYGFLGGETSQWEPQLIRNTTPVEAPQKPEQGYHLTEDLVKDAIQWVKRQKSLAPDKPYFMYFASGAAHAPLHAPQEWVDKFKGQFDDGWDAMREHTIARQKKMGIVPQNTKLTSRPDAIPSWEEQSDDAKKLFARQMEVYAGFLAHTDYCIGKMIDEIQAMPNGKNTLIIYVTGDNGASAEGTMVGTLNNIMTQNGFPDSIERQLAVINEIGGAKHENHYAVPWAWAGSTPFQWMKRVPSHLGGTRNGLIISWPKGIKSKGEIRNQFHHVVDIAPTIYQAVGITMPEKVNGVAQIPIVGTSMNYSFDDANAESTHHTQYFETGGHRAIYHDGWIASSFHGVPWQLTGSIGFDGNKWELYNIDEDFSQSVDLAQIYPEKLKQMQKLFDIEAEKYSVFPLDDRFVERVQNPHRPSMTRGKEIFRYTDGTERIPEGSAPAVYSRSHDITASIEYKRGDEGVIVANGGSSGGYSLYIQNNKLHYTFNFFHLKYYTVSSDALPEGKLELKMSYKQTGKGHGAGGNTRLFVNNKEVASGTIGNTIPSRYSATETMDIGKDLGAAVVESYHAPFTYMNKINYVQFDLK